MRWPLLITALMMIGLADASFSIHQNSSFINDRYFSGEFISGKINMSFSEQENKKFTSNFNGSINLFDLLLATNLTPGRNFSCNPANCREGYKINGFLAKFVRQFYLDVCSKIRKDITEEDEEDLFKAKRIGEIGLNEKIIKKICSRLIKKKSAAFYV